MSRGVVLVVLALLAVARSDSPPKTFTMCVPEIYEQDCVKMMQESTSKGIPISCVTGRDRLECIEKVGKNEADVVAVDPEDMYLAAKSKLAAEAGYNVVEQVRTKEEPDEPYRYEAVCVIHKDLEIYDVHGLHGLKSCHTGVGRNVGYKIPITKLTEMNVLGDIHNPEFSARENELKALSSLFSKGCLVGKWSPEPSINARLKETYSNMCALCEKPEVCDYPDNYSGYEGALRCLSMNGGDVAWTKVIYVKRFFGLPVGRGSKTTATKDPSDYRYFCPDGTKVPIDAVTKPCTWAARPWQGYMTNGKVKNIDGIQKELTELGEVGEKENANWWKHILLLDEKTLAVKTAPVAPEEHLTNAKYLDVIERNSGAVERTARWCVWGDRSPKKCQALARAAYSRDARPQLECVQKNSRTECLEAIRDDAADFALIEASSVKQAIENFKVKPIVAESFGMGQTKFSEKPAVAVVKKNSPIKSLADLKGKKSCHRYWQEDYAGWIAPVSALLHAKLVKSEEEVSDFFAASCAPGAPIKSKLCEQCAGNAESNDDSIITATKCQPNHAEAFSGKGALKCLAQDKGDVAFVPLTDVYKLRNDTSLGLNIDDVKLICPNGSTASVSEAETCNLGLEAPQVIVSSGTKSANALEELTHGIISATTLYNKRPDLLQLFGAWGGEKNILFQDDTVELVATNDTWNTRFDDWSKMPK
uniref:Transferrin n=1 Tax=Fopius arisanus TaxID=64838 RepID=A0A0C9RQZ4_9HYME